LTATGFVGREVVLSRCAGWTCAIVSLESWYVCLSADNGLDANGFCQCGDGGHETCRDICDLHVGGFFWKECVVLNCLIPRWQPKKMILLFLSLF
jgi:hypothetical protein